MCIHVCCVRAVTVNVLKEPFQKPDLSVTVTNDEEVCNKMGGRGAMCWCFNLTKGCRLSLCKLKMTESAILFTI